MASLHDLLPDAETVMALEPEELAGVLLALLNSLPERDRQQLNRHNFCMPHGWGSVPLVGEKGKAYPLG